MKSLAVAFILSLLPWCALAQSQTARVDCTAYQKKDDGRWAIKRPNVIESNGKSIPVEMTDACCFAADSNRLMISGINIIRIVQRACL